MHHLHGNAIPARGGCPRSVASAKFHDCGFNNVGLLAPKSLKLVFLVYIFPKGVYSLKRFLQNLAYGERLPGPHPLAKLTIVTFKCGLTPLKIAEIGNFWYKFAQKGYTPEAIFTIFGLRESQVRILIPNFTVLALKMWAHSPKNCEKMKFME